MYNKFSNYNVTWIAFIDNGGNAAVLCYILRIWKTFVT